MLRLVRSYAPANMARPPDAVPQPPGTPSAEALVAQARAGSRDAFEALVRRYQRPSYFLCHRYVRDPDEAADLAQRTFIRAFGKVNELRGVEVFRTWLFRIGVNLCLNQL